MQANSQTVRSIYCAIFSPYTTELQYNKHKKEPKQNPLTTANKTCSKPRCFPGKYQQPHTEVENHELNKTHQVNFTRFIKL